jgi:SAM-dependent methyltransferase
MLALARQKGFPGNVDFLQADVHRIPLPDAAFDRVICNAAFPHFEDRTRTLGEMIRVLRPGGVLVISHPIGREAVNALHREVGGPVEQDRVPAASVMVTLLEGAGLAYVRVIDEPAFYLAAGRRPREDEPSPGDRGRVG